jgi:hypothetical protein
VLSNGHAGFGGRSGETHQRKRRQGAPGRPNRLEGKTGKEALRCLKRQVSDVFARLRPMPSAPRGHALRDPGGQRERLCRQRGRTHPRAFSRTSHPGPTPHPTRPNSNPGRDDQDRLSQKTR